VQPYRRRNSLRLADYDYATPGYYHVTVIVAGRLPLLGEMKDETSEPSSSGLTVIDSWNELLSFYPWVWLDEFVVMPDHIHGIIRISDVEERQSLSIVMRKFKSSSSLVVNRNLGRKGTLWQRGFFDRVIRNDRELNATRAYIRNNPVKESLILPGNIDVENRVINHRCNRKPGRSYRRRPYV